VHFFFYLSFNFDFFDFFLYFIACICYKLPIITSMKAASIDGPYGLLAASPIINIEMYCGVDYWENKILACLLNVYWNVR